jgi:hypothetical protein
MKDDKWVAVVYGKEGASYDGIGGDGASIVLDPDGKSFAYVAYAGGKGFVVLNGEEGRKYDDIAAGTPVFSPDGKRIFYGAKKKNKWVVVIDGEEKTDEYEEISRGAVFSSDGKYLMYTALNNGKWFVVINDKAGPGYDRLFRPVFTEDGIEYLAERESDGRLLRIRQPYPAGDIDAEDYKAMVEEIVLASLPEPKGECEACKRNRK